MTDFYKALRQAMHEQACTVTQFTQRWREMTAWQHQPETKK